jgi:hypothetical protein
MERMVSEGMRLICCLPVMGTVSQDRIKDRRMIKEKILSLMSIMTSFFYGYHVPPQPTAVLYLFHDK